MIAVKLLLLITVCQGDATSRGLTWRPPDGDLSDNSIENGAISQSPIPENLETDDLFFKASSNDSSMILTDVTNCLSAYNLMECFKMFLLMRVKSLVVEMDKLNTTGIDYSLLNGMVVFKWRNESGFENLQEFSPNMDLSRTLNVYVQQLFKSRSLQLKLFPGVGLELTPKAVSDENGLVCFSAKTFKADDSDEVDEMRKKGDKGKKKKKKGGGFNMMPMMIVPQMIMLGMLPFALANLKMMVMNAFMMNSMALNGAIAMTIRNMVFGPKSGPKVKYVNYGYNKPKINKKPEIVLHSPAAFVKKPHHHISRTENKTPQNRIRLTSKPSAVQPYSDGFPTQHEETYSEAPSYLNNNQNLHQNSPNYENDESSGSSNYDDSYQAYSNVHLQPYEGNAGNTENKHYSSTYKESSNYYPNHRLH